ncbi:hypothetical protein PVAP13_3KG227642 [Panicum virgatum]|uniref:Uncharacterized protein n=1 Tax=Panicum virgatum TaxID=38727 RepID=A0A8T0UYS7_PANVG|nr:hypothetical protein PVAP13_3KG227642 [Panicum virgatum]
MSLRPICTGGPSGWSGWAVAYPKIWPTNGSPLPAGLSKCQTRHLLRWREASCLATTRPTRRAPEPQPLPAAWRAARPQPRPPPAGHRSWLDLDAAPPVRRSAAAAARGAAQLPPPVRRCAAAAQQPPPAAMQPASGLPTSQRPKPQTEEEGTRCMLVLEQEEEKQIT